MRKLLSAMMAFALFSMPVAQALPENLSWRYAGWGGGGAYPQIVPDPNVAGRIYLLSDVCGLWRSDNRGEEWNFRTKGLGNLKCVSLAVAPSNSNILYLGTSIGVHKSTDAGDTWSLLPASSGLLFTRPQNYRSVVVDPTDANRVWIGTNNGRVFQTGDGGGSWQQVGDNPFGSAVAISSIALSEDGQTLYVGSTSGVRSTGARAYTGWRMVLDSSVKANDMMSYNGRLYVTAGLRVASSADGVTWEYSTNAPYSGEAYRLAVGPAGSATKIYVAWRNGWSGGAVLSQDGGASWTNVERNLRHDLAGSPTRAWSTGFGWPLSAAIDPFDESKLYFSDFWGHWRSDDNGASWDEKIRGAANTIGSDVDISSDGRVLIGTMDNGLVTTPDAGLTWRSLAPVSSSDPSMNGHVWRVVSRGAKIVATNSPWDAGPNQVLVSENGGATFTKTRNGLPSSYPTGGTVWDKGYARALAQDPVDPRRYYLGIDGNSGGGFFYSTDGGYSWTRSSGQPGALGIYNGLAVDPTEPSRIFWGAIATGGGVYRSENYGLNWTKVFSGSSYVFDLKVGPDGTVYAGTDTGGPSLYVSRNKGTTWSLLKKFPGSGTCEGIAIDPSNPARVAVSTVKWSGYVPCQIYVTEDGGTTWRDITADLPPGSGAAAMAFSPDGKTLVMSRDAGGVFKMDVSVADTTVPSTPQNLAYTVSMDTVHLAWDASIDNTGVAGYKVFRNGTEIATAAVNFYQDSTARIGIAYFYSVKAFDAAQNLSSSSNQISLTLNDTTPPSKPATLAASPGAFGVSLTWEPSLDNVGVTGYRVSRNGNTLGTVTSLSYEDETAVAATAYSYTVTAFDAALNDSDPSDPATITLNDTAPPTVPQALAADVQNDKDVNLSWQASTDNVGVTGYRVIRNGIEIGTTVQASFRDSTGAFETPYSYTVRAYDVAGNESASSEAVSVTLHDTTAPNSPAGLAAALADTQINMTWTASTDNVGVTGYRVYNGQTQIGTSASESFTVTSVVPGATYSLTVKAEDAAGNLSAASNVASVTVPVPPDATAPRNMTVAMSSGLVRIDWDAPLSFAVHGYSTYRDGVYLKSSTTTAQSDGTAVNGRTYKYKVLAYDALGRKGGFSDEVTITASGVADTSSPTAPAGLAAALSGTQINLTWIGSTDNVGVTGYRVYNGQTQIGTSASASFTVTSAVPGATYSLTVKAEDGAGNLSASSNAASVTVPASGSPTNLTAAASGTTQVRLAWTAPAGFPTHGYSIYRNNAYLKSCTTTAQYDTVNRGVNYTYTVLAYDVTGKKSPTSNSATIRL